MQKWTTQKHGTKRHSLNQYYTKQKKASSTCFRIEGKEPTKISSIK